MDSTGFKTLGRVALRAMPSALHEPHAIVPIRDHARLPLTFDHGTDREIPDRVVCFWFGSGEKKGKPLLRRELTLEERQALERRRHDLRCAVAEADPESRDDLLGAISGMLGAFPAMQRHNVATSLAIAASYLWSAREYPHWAIMRACQQVRENSAGLNPSFCPSEPEFVGICLNLVSGYARQLAATEAILAAPVYEPPPEQRMTRAEIEAKLGHPIGEKSGRSANTCIADRPGDGKHAERVAADLERRRAARQSTEQQETP